jgi:hypothetical protein
MALTLEEELRGEKIMQRDKEKLEKIAKMQKSRLKKMKEQRKERQQKLNSVKKKVRKQEERILMQSLGIFREKLYESKRGMRGRGKGRVQCARENLRRKHEERREREDLRRQEQEVVERRLLQMEVENRRIQANIVKIRQRKQKSFDRLFQREGVGI